MRAKFSSVPASPSATAIAASLPDCTMMPRRRSDFHAAVELREHGGAAGLCAALAPGVLRDRELAVHVIRPCSSSRNRISSGHQLGHAGRRERLVGGLLEQDRAGIRIEQKRVRGLCLEALRLRGRVHEDREDRKCGQPYSRLGWQAGKGREKGWNRHIRELSSRRENSKCAALPQRNQRQGTRMFTALI